MVYTGTLGNSKSIFAITAIVIVSLVVISGVYFSGQKATTLVRTFSNASITFDSATYDPNTPARITVIDPSVNTNSSTMQTIFVRVISDSDATGIQVRLDENGTNSSQFVTHPYLVNLTPLTSNPSTSALQIAPGDNIHAQYSHFTATAQMTSGRRLPSPANETGPGGGINITGTGVLTNTFPTTGMLSPTGVSISSNTIPVFGCLVDSDHDGICDEWENSAVFPGLQISDPNTGVTYQLPCNTTIVDDCPDSTMKDIYVQASYMDIPGTISQAPTNAAISDLQKVFRAHSIRLHFLSDPQSIGYYNDLTQVPGSSTDLPGTNSLYGIKNAYFGTPAERTCPTQLPPGMTCDTYLHDYLTEKSQVFHYGLFIHAQAAKPGSSGWSEIFGNDFVVSMGAFDGGVGSENQQAGTIMHELGHNLNLNHGGPSTDLKNCKPNYLSAMSYTRQFPYFVHNWSLDYSKVKFDLNEAGLWETRGINNVTPNVTAYSYKVANGAYAIANGPMVAGNDGIDWDGTDRTFQSQALPTPPSPLEIQNLGIPECNTISADQLLGYNDWANINLQFQNSPNFANGASFTDNPEREMTREDVNKLFMTEYGVDSTGKNLDKLYKDMSGSYTNKTHYAVVLHK